MGPFDITELGEDLTPPEDGGRQLKGHDPLFLQISEGYDATRDTINDALGKINSLGIVHVPTLPEKSIEDFIVYPLSGNYKHIQANGDACAKVHKAMGRWADNFRAVGLQVPAAFQGRASLSFVAQMEAYRLVMDTLGSAVGTGTTVFADIAEVSEEIAIEVEKIIIVVGKKLTKLMFKLSTRVLSYVGWLILAEEIVKNGMDAITDIYDDAKEVAHLIKTCFELVETITAWAQVQADRLHAFEELIHIVKRLPDLGPVQTLDELGHLDLTPFHHLPTPDFGDSHSPEEDALDNTMDNTVESSGYEPDDGEGFLDRLRTAVEGDPR